MEPPTWESAEDRDRPVETKPDEGIGLRKRPKNKPPTEPVGAGIVAGRVLRTLTTWGLIGFSLVFYAQQLRGRWVDKFIEGNELDIGVRNLLLLTLVLGAVVGALFPGAFLLWKRTKKALDQVNAAARIASPLVLIGAAPAIFRWKPWINNPMGLGLAILTFSLVLERTLRISFQAVPPRFWDWLQKQKEKLLTRFPRTFASLPFVVVVLSALFYIAFFSIMSLRLHHRLDTRAFDLGGYESLFYNALSGHPFRCPANVMPSTDWSSLKGHAELTTYVLLPFYAISPRAETLLIIQSSLLGLAAIPLYLIAARHTSKAIAVIISLCYLCFPALHSANLFDFHMQPVAIFFVLWVAYFIDTRRYLWLIAALPIALGCREDIGIGLTIGALYLVFTGYRPVAGAIVALVSTSYFFIIRFVIMPMMGQWWFEDIYKDLFPPGQHSYFGVLKTLITNPVFVFGTLLTQAKLIHVLRIFTPLALIPLRHAHLWWLLIPGAFFTILTTGYRPTVTPTFQYVGHWIPYLFLATIVALAAIRKSDGRIRQSAAVVTMVVATLAATYNWGAFLQRNHMEAGWGRVNLAPLTDEEKLKLEQLRGLIALIPPDASVGASENELPHLSNRVDAQTLRYSYDRPDYILYRVGIGKFGSDQGDKEQKEKRYVRIESRGPFVLLERADRIKKEP